MMESAKDSASIWDWLTFTRPPRHPGLSLDLTEKVAIVTGGNAGIGYQTSLGLLNQNCHVILACRSPARAQAAIESMKREANPHARGHVEFLQVDFGDLESVASAVLELRKREGLKVDYLINNAGIMMVPFALSRQGIESQFATNHLGHMLFTQLLLPLMRGFSYSTLPTSEPSAARIINISSMAHAWSYPCGILQTPEDLNSGKKYNAGGAYGQSKLANILYTRRLARLLEKTDIKVNAVHPGWVKTDIVNHIRESYGQIAGRVGELLTRVCGIEKEDGAFTTLFVALNPDVKTTGGYFIPFGRHVNPSSKGLDYGLEEHCWTMSMDLIAHRAPNGKALVEEMEAIMNRVC